MFQPTQTSPESNRFRWARLTVFAAYVLIYGALLWRTDGYPYVFDNNESYSSWWHARSMYENGVSQTKGLTDEVFSTQRSASPYIHSHQGNFPRLFTFVLYAVGLRSIESHIWISTFTVGLAALWFAFRFLSRLGNPLFATLTCLVLMTDYLFFTQWQVSLYNVWHGFFFFSSLLCVQTLGTTPHRGRWFALTALNFAALFYWEYVFTAFVTVLCGLYAALIYRRRFRLALLVWCGIATGATLAAGLLLAQLTAYMGWNNVMEDVRLTLTARNATADPVLLDRVTTFYREHRIIFWHNFFDAAPLRSWPALLESLLQHHLKFYSPTLLYAVLVLFVGWLMGHWRWLGGMLGRQAANPPGVGPVHLVPLGAGAGQALLTAGCIAHVLPVLAFPGSSVLAAPLALLLGYFWTGQWWGWPRIGWLRFIPMCLFVTIAGWAMRWTGSYLDSALQEQWLATPGSWALPVMEKTILLASTGLALTCAVVGRAQLLGRLRCQQLTSLLPFLLCAIAAYAATYRLFTGYIYSGYLHRFVPMPVFISALLLGLLLYIIARTLQRNARRAKRAVVDSVSSLRCLLHAAGNRQREQAVSELATRLVRIVPFALCFAAFAGLFAYWALLQATYARIAPADNYAFLSQLEQTPFKGRSLVTNGYPAPIAARTGSWAYADTSIFSGRVTLTPKGYEVERDLKYLWFADRDTNPEYQRPAFALTVTEAPNFSEALKRYREWQSDPPGVLPRVENTSLFKRARDRFQPFMHHQVAATDGRRYSIVQLDWDFPPYLKPQDAQMQELARQLTLQQKLALSAASHDVSRRWRVELDFLNASPAGRAGVELTCDGLPVVLPESKTDGPQNIIVGGDRLRLRLLRSREEGQVRVSVNDTVELIDLHTMASADTVFEWSAAQPHGKYTRIPSFTPGIYLQTNLLHQSGEPVADLVYRYAHQEGSPEAATTVRLYQEDSTNRWHLVDAVTFLGSPGVPVRLAEFRRANPDTIAEHARNAARGDARTYEQWLGDHLAGRPAEWTGAGIVREALPAPLALPADHGAPTVRRVPLPANKSGRFQFSVSPGTRTKTGPEYFGLPFSLGAFKLGSANTVAFAAPASSDVAPGLPFGQLRLKLRLPANHWPQSEPIVTTGSNEAGDFVYVIYHDAQHIRLGFDHWFKGGPVTKPIPVDFTKEHELVISIGSLFPASEDIVFAGTPAAAVAGLKNRVVITLDGRTVIDSEATCYDSSPDQVTVGRNAIRGTSCGPEFSGEILTVQREWPALP